MNRQPTLNHVTWIIDLFNNRQLNLNPPYQRKSVWSPKDKRFFLDTIFRNYPTPPIFIHRQIDDNGFSTYNVVDGKQRLETILDFANNKIFIDKEFGDESLNGKKFRDLTPENKRKFWNYILVIDFIEIIAGNNINEVFDRVNRNAKNLEPQELRHARFEGWFIKEAESESEEPFWTTFKVSSKAKDKRMKNVQTVSELLLINLENDIVGFDQEYLDAMYAKYDGPEETVDDFDVDTYVAKKQGIKEYITAMNVHNQDIQNFAKTANNIYTLWAIISMNYGHLPEPNQLADNYIQFMNNVQRIAGLASADGYVPAQGDESYFLYFTNSKGASTDEPQRRNRLNALNIILHQ